MYLHSVLQGTAELWCSLICVFRFLSIETTSRDSYLSPLGLMPWQIFVQKEAEASWPCVCHIHQEWSMWFCVWDSFVGHSLEELSRVPGKHTRLELQESICLKLLRHPVPFTWSIWLLCPSVWLWSFHSVDNKTETQSWNLAEDKLPVTTWKQLTALHDLLSWLLGEILLHFYVFYVWICVGGKSKITFNHWACSSLDKILLYSHYFYMT